MSRAERREGDRVPVLGELLGGVMVFQPMAVIEIGLAGMQIETAGPLQLDSLHDFRLPLHDTPVIVKGRVVHSRIADIDPARVRYRTGIEFIEPSDHARAALAVYLEQMRKAKADAIG